MRIFFQLKKIKFFVKICFHYHHLLLLNLTIINNLVKETFLPLLMLFQLVSSSQLSKLTSFDTSGAIVGKLFSPTIINALAK